MNRQIFVVDDDEGLLAAFEAVLETAGYDVQTCLDSGCLQSMNQREKPGLILLDVLLSGVDGRDVCRWLKSQKTTKDIPVIMVSAHPSAAKNVKEFGADDFLAKPFEMDELLLKVEKYIKTS